MCWFLYFIYSSSSLLPFLGGGDRFGFGIGFEIRLYVFFNGFGGGERGEANEWERERKT